MFVEFPEKSGVTALTLDVGGRRLKIIHIPLLLCQLLVTS